MRKKQISLWLMLLVALSPSYAQVLEPVKWSFSLNRISETQVEVIADATIDNKWHLYSTTIPDGGPIPTSLHIEASDTYEAIGELRQTPEPKPFFDEAFQMELGYFSKSARLTQTIELKQSGSHIIRGYVEFMVCDDSRCLPPDQVEFELSLAGSESAELAAAIPEGEADSALLPGGAAGNDATSVISANEAIDSTEDKGYWAIFWLSFLGGLAALLTPCVFPMIPLTVSFFLRNADNRRKALRDGFFYGLTIIFAYVFLGLLIAIIFGADALNNMATSPVFNIIFFALLLFFAASFLGAFELTMPSKWSNKLDSKADSTGGVLGVILMGLTFVLVSFSCTGPIVGTLLVEAAVGGSMFSPAIGMLGFGLALAIPFTLFAIFPTAMKSLPKSGGWMNAVKVVLGFIVLAFSLKFLSIADSVMGWGILDREVFIAIWIALFFIMGLYLIGKIKFAHDSDLTQLSVGRLGLAIATFAFVVYLIPGLWGAPLKAVSSFLPSITTQDFNLNENRGGTLQTSVNLPQGASVVAGPYGLMKYTDYREGLSAAREAGKPVFLDFTGLACANCKKMINNVWSDSRVTTMLAEDFIIISLYVDDRSPLPESGQYVSEVTGKRIRTVGNKWSDFQISRYQNNSQPYYLLLDHDEKPLNAPCGYNPDVEAYVKWMQEGKASFTSPQ